MRARRCTALVAMVFLWTVVADASWRPRWRRQPKQPTQPGQTQPGQTQPGQTQPGQTQPGQTQPDHQQPNPNHGRRPSIHVVRPHPATVQQGGSHKLTWTVTGTDKPVRLRLRNNRPAIGMFERGGETTVITTKGGTPNTATVIVMGLSPGSFDIEVVEIDGEPVVDQTDRAAEIDQAFRTELRRIADQLERDAENIPVRTPRSSLPPTVQREEVLRLFARVEKEVRNSLPYRELAPFHDAVAELMAQVRSQVDALAVPRNAATSRPDIVLVVGGKKDKLEESSFRSLAAGVVSFFRNLSNTSPADTVCVLTTPEAGANLVFSSPSFPSHRIDVFTNSRKTLYLGRYKYEITRSGYAMSQGYVNLLLDPQRVVECTLPRTTAASHGCRPIGGTLDRCP